MDCTRDAGGLFSETIYLAEAGYGYDADQRRGNDYRFDGSARRNVSGRRVFAIPRRIPAHDRHGIHRIQNPVWRLLPDCPGANDKCADYTTGRFYVQRSWFYEESADRSGIHTEHSDFIRADDNDDSKFRC